MARSRASRAQVPPRRLVLDSGAIIGLSRGEGRPRRFLERAIRDGAVVLVSPVVLAETIRANAPRDAPVNRVLQEVDAVAPITETTGRIAGRLLGNAQSDATIDALIVAAAVEIGGARILTSDPADFRRLAAGEAGVVIHSI